MGLFIRNPNTGATHLPLYTTSLENTLLIVGLGNPGKKYDGTRHNLGFAVLDHFASQNGPVEWQDSKKFKAKIAEVILGSTRVFLLKPQTYMNLSGEAVLAAQQFYKIPPEQVWVVHDELDIPYGQIRTRMGGSSAGHNGIESIIKSVGEAFGRIRIGIEVHHQEIKDTADFVLQKFPEDEQRQVPELLREVTAILSESIFSGELRSETRSFIL